MAEENVEEAKQEEFPSDVGREDVEVAERTTDEDDATAERFTKVYVIGLPISADLSELHEANKAITLQEAITNGLHPKGDVTFDGAEENETPGNTDATYSVEVEPAHVDDNAVDTNVPSSDEISAE